MVVSSMRDVACQMGNLACPFCGGLLRPWGFARRRVMRLAGSEVWWRPRRARCSCCGRTQVLLPAVALSRRRDSSGDVGEVLEAYAFGKGYRRVARDRRIPIPTARNWIRGLRGRWEDLAGCVDPASGSAHTVEVKGVIEEARLAVNAVRRGARAAGWSGSVWEFASFSTNGRLLVGCNTS